MGSFKDSIKAKLGVRGQILAIFGLMFILIGINTVLMTTQTPGMFHTYAWAPVRFIWWAVPGLLALIASVRVPPKWDGFGFIALMVPVAIMVASNFGSVALYYVTDLVVFVTGQGTPIGSPYGWQAAFVWFGLGGIIGIINGNPDIISLKEYLKTDFHRDFEGPQ
jgi:hypothetical protein